MLKSILNETFLATITGASVAFLGVLLTLREERKKTKEEREFLAKHKALESAVVSVTRFLNYYITLPDRELPKNGTNPEEVSEMAVALNCLHFYCDIETINHSITMSQTLSKSYISALKAKMPSMFTTEGINALELQIVNLEKSNNQIQQEIIVLLSLNHSNPLLVSHRQQLADNLKNISELHEKKNDLIKAKYHETEACRDMIRKDLKEVYDTLRNVLLIARRELAFPIDERQYSNILNQATELALSEMDKFIDEIRSEVARRW